MAQEVRLRGLRWFIGVLGVVGFAISFEALRQHIVFTNGLAAGGSFCDISQYVSCNAVNASEWSTFLGIPIASYGIFFYLTLLGLSLLSGPNKAVSYRAMASISLLGGVVSVGTSLILLALSLFVIRALCILCIGLYAVNLLLLLVTWRLAFKSALSLGLVEGYRALTLFLRAVLGSTDAQISKGARLSLISLLVLATCSWAVGPVMHKLLSLKVDPGMEIAREAFLEWKGGRAVSLPLSRAEGALGDHPKGTTGAPIQIVEFADFECPGCRRMYFNLKELLQEYPGKYQLIFRNYPLDHRCNAGIKEEFHRYACAAALFSRCAGEQGRFWEAVDWLFLLPELQGEAELEDFRGVLLEKGAQSLELDPEGLAQCMDSERQMKGVQDDIALADRLGLEATPAFWINGKKVSKPTVAGFKLVFSSILGAQ